MTLHALADTRVDVLAQDGPPITTAHDAIQLVIDTDHDAEWIALPTSRLPEDFFHLRTGLAGEITQKLANYHLRVALVGPIPDTDSTALADFVRESNRGTQFWFVTDLHDLERRLT